MKQSILTTGFTGLVGSRIHEMLSEKYDFLNMDLSTGVDITDKQAIKNFVDNNPAETLIHLAAFTNVNEAFKQTNDEDGICYKVNVTGTQNVAEICKENNIYLIHMSTDFVFSGNKNEAYTEEDKKDPIEWYGKTKALAEDKIEGLLDKYSILRIGFPFRADFPEKPDIVANTRKGLQEGNLYPQFSDMVITPTYIDDLARTIDSIIQQKPLGIFHLNGSTSLSPYELSQKIADVFGLDKSVIKEGSLEEFLKTTDRPYQKTLRISNDKAKKLLGVSLFEIDDALEDLKNQLSN